MNLHDFDISLVGRRRLSRLERYLRSPKVKKHWNYSRVATHKGEAHPRGFNLFDCGSAGCVWGHTPVVFPTLLTWNVFGHVMVKSRPSSIVAEDWTTFFDIGYAVGGKIFAAQESDWPMPPVEVSPVNVANRIRAFLDKREDWYKVI